MSPDPVVVRPYQPLLEAVALMAERGFRHVPVADADGRLIGMVSDGDVRTAIGDPAEALHQDLTELEELQVSSVMTIPAQAVHQDTSLAQVARRLADGSVSAFPVLDDHGRIVGLVSCVDVLQALLDLVAPRDGATAGAPMPASAALASP